MSQPLWIPSCPATIELRRQSRAVAQLHAIASRYIPGFAQASEVMLTAWQRRTSSAEIEAAVRADNVDAAVRAVSKPINATSPNDLIALQRRLVGGDQLAGAYGGGTARGAAVANVAPDIGPRSVVGRATAYSQQHSAKMIKQVGAETKAAVRTIVTQGLESGDPVRTVARNAKEIIGLTDHQAQAVVNFRRQLETQSTMGLTSPTDRRLNALQRAMVRRQMAEGKMTGAQIDRLVRGYRGSLVQLRANTIARQEVFAAMNTGQRQVWATAQAEGLLSGDAMRGWRNAGDDRVRPAHRNVSPVALDQMFDVGGEMVAGPPHGIGCRCVEELVRG